MKRTIFVIFISLFACAVAFSSIDTEHYATNNSHKILGVECVDCHGSKEPTTAPSLDKGSAMCSVCHESLAALGKTTSAIKPNPHDTHLGAMDCYECHNTHKPSVNMCGSCHTFTMNVP